jgi:hypothetical protein
MAEQVRAAAGPRADDIEIALNHFAVGDEELPPWVSRFIGADVDTLIEHDSLTLLRGSAVEMADELQRRRDAIGASYISVNGAYMEKLAPVIERLAGR